MNRVWLIAPLIAGILWGSIGILVRTLTSFGFDNQTVLFARFSIAIVILFFGLLIVNKNLLKVKLKDLWLFACSGILGSVLLNICLNTSVNTLSLSLAAVLMATSPIFVIIFSAFLFKEKITVRKILCSLLALLGCALVSGIFEGGYSGASPLFVLVGLGSAFFYSLYTVFSKLAMERGYHTFTIIFYSFVFATIALAPTADYATIGTFVSADPAFGIFFLLLHSLVTSVIPYILFTMSLSHIDAGFAGILCSAGDPIGALFIGTFVYGEFLSILMVVGVAVVIVAVALLSLSPSKEMDATTSDKPDKKSLET